MTKKIFFAVFILVACLMSSCKQRDYNGDLITETSCPSNKVYFQNTIQPILLSHCAIPNCHNSTTHAAGVNLSSYSSVMNVVIWDEPENSLLYTKIASNEMPQNPYPHLSSQQKQYIYDWIDQGAFNNYCADCDTTQYHFSSDIFPIIQLNCTGCHGSLSPGGGVKLLNYTDVKLQVDSMEIQGVLNATSHPLTPPPIVLQDCEKTRILNWINIGAPNN